MLHLALAVLVEVASAAPPLETVAHVDLERYLGTWYEIARYPNRFQRRCTATTAHYSLRDDGSIEVVNRCRRDRPDGPERSVTGRARVVDPVTNAKLSVQFFWPFRGPYWIIELDPDYRDAVVGHPRRRYLWILAREPALDGDRLATLYARLEDVHHYDTARLLRTQH